MPVAYYSTIFQERAAEIWEIVRDFNNYPVWVDGCGESRIEDGKSGDTVGAVRNVLYQDRQVRQRLLSLSDLERSQTYEFCSVPSLPMTGFRATLRISEVVDGDHAFIEWWANFDCEPAQAEELAKILRVSFAKWLESLRMSLAGAGRESASSTPWRPSINGSGPVRRLWP